MKKYNVFLTKSYIVEIDAKNEESAKRYSEFFTGDIFDISTIQSKKKYNFKIYNIENTFTESFGAEKTQ